MWRFMGSVKQVPVTTIFIIFWELINLRLADLKLFIMAVRLAVPQTTPRQQIKICGIILPKIHKMVCESNVNRWMIERSDAHVLTVTGSKLNMV